MKRESISTKTFVKGIAAGAVVAASLGALNFSDYSTAMKNSRHSFVPGTYTGSAKGMESDVKVQITVDESRISAVSVDVSGETPEIGAAIGDEVSAQIMEAQSSAIDGVTGATISSTAVREALDLAIEKAEAGEADAGEPAAEDAQTEAVSEAAAGTVTEAAAANEAETVSEAAGDAQAVAEGAGAEQAAVEAVTEGAGANQTDGAAAASVSYTPGTYAAENAGARVALTVSDSRITAASVSTAGGTLDAALAREILTGQSAEPADLPILRAVAEAAQKCVDQAADAAEGEDLYGAGTYTAVSGENPDVRAAISFDKTRITSVSVSTPDGKNDAACVKEILASQSAQLASVPAMQSVADAAADCLAQASGQAG